MKCLWATDIHLDHCNEDTLTDFWNAMATEQPDVVLLTGDIAEGETVIPWLQRMQTAVGAPVYFILGNHDYYHSSIAWVRQQMVQFNQSQTELQWLGAAPVIALTPEWGLLGCDGWGDGRHGDFLGSTVKLKDYRLIAELAAASSAMDLWRQLQGLGDAEATYLAHQLNQAQAYFPKILVLTHPPPFAEACFYLGHVSADANWLPHFTCQAVGNVLLDFVNSHPHHELLVLAGHSHNPCDVTLNPQLRVCVGAAEYGAPCYETVWLV